MPNGLTERQRKFVALYVACRRGDQAAAGAGYSAKWAASAASRLLRQPEIAAAIARRAGAPAQPEPAEYPTPLAYLLAVMGDREVRLAQRMQAAIAAMPFCHARLAPAGQKQFQAEAAGKASTGRFAPTKQPGTVVPLRLRPKD